MNRGIDLRFVWQTALLDSFLTTWLPHSLVRDHTNGRDVDALVPMSAWPVVAWKLAKRKDESFVAHALLCLTLCVIGSQTQDLRLLAEAAQHYTRVLHQFQAQIRLLVQTGYSAKQDDHVASLAAAGFCCSQVEYILESWSNGDRHLQGMASLLEACGPACLRHEDTRNIFYDHYLLWTSCAITHHEASLYSQEAWKELDWFDFPESCKAFLKVPARLSPLLEEYDTVRQFGSASEVKDLAQRLTDIMVDIETLGQTDNFSTRTYSTGTYPDYSRPSTPCQVSDNSHLAIVSQAYLSAFLTKAGVAMWDLVMTLDTDKPCDFPTPKNWDAPLNHESTREGCERHLSHICQSIDELADDRFGMITSSPLLFLLDTAWIGYQAMHDFYGYDLEEVRPWFMKIGAYVTSTGYRPLRQPWLTDNMILGPGLRELYEVPVFEGFANVV